ncbi:glycoside hydrolase family 16 protein [Hypholoma sublateritium FD-334 SS-4]|uniref:Glycoside hydrolase family 16 protein n=1 Tax=Hypholoma sublateritium (strain FD-334 SS-4) TaxID=945553 RepID=A0A0D2LMK0_HYPSF|nr:glycoside hydrolase family 16 protein [Hypholoma sublateritium FD-334 SS-4]
MVLESRDSVERNANGSAFIWLPNDDYSGNTFYDRWTFWDQADPTNYVNRSTAFEERLVYVQDDGRIIMKADDTTRLDKGTFRKSVRIESVTKYDGGLFILDLNQAPWGCAVWPAFWTYGNHWPNNGEIDVIEGVHDNEHNQIAFHTADGCKLNSNVSFTGTTQKATSTGQNQTDCNGLINDNSGCGITEWSRASYGPYFDRQGGGIFAMKWDENDISVWSFFRAAIPSDVTAGSPAPSTWGLPSAKLDSSLCDIERFFSNHSIVFDITFCGDWAGNTYATSLCPGTCEERLMEPSNFANATWSINSLKVYKKQNLAGQSPLSSSASYTSHHEIRCMLGVLLFMPLIPYILSLGIHDLL